MRELFWGDTPVRNGRENSHGEFVERDGESFYKISNYQAMRPFLISVVSGSNHWMFISSTGGLTCGRHSPESALFPYYTDDKLHDAHCTTGPQTAFLIDKGARVLLWKPLSQDVSVYSVERNLYKNLPGNKLIFEEINHDLQLTFSCCWSSSERFGFVRKSVLRNFGDVAASVEVLDGIRNLLPYGVTEALQTSMSTLLDAYKQSEAVAALNTGIYTLSSILTDRAKPCEALNATVVWGVGLDQPQLLLSEEQVGAFCSGQETTPEAFKRGQRGAFYNRSAFSLSPATEKSWFVIADVEQGPSQIAQLLRTIRQGGAAGMIEQDLEAGQRRLVQLVGSADGCQFSSDPLVTGRHFSNTLFNIMRGGTFYEAYTFPAHDFRNFVSSWNHAVGAKFESILKMEEGSPTRDLVIRAAAGSGDADFERISLEYLPLIFSRRHGDPSRPWNHFSIDLINEDGSDKLGFQGNWRDIFQNWEALAISYPEYVESFIAKFVNASTADGYNPYRISKEGIDWETLEPESPWSNIGYWGDHQITYLLRLLEFSRRHHPDRVIQYLARDIFVYVRVPYRLKAFELQLQDPRNTVEFDDDLAQSIELRVQDIGKDGKLMTLANGSICRVNLLEKLLLPLLVKMGNLVPGGGIWMNTQRPEWNDANNALVGYGLSMVTLCYLRRFLNVLADFLSDDPDPEYPVSVEVLAFFNGINELLDHSQSMTASVISDSERKDFMHVMGSLGESYRSQAYQGFSGSKGMLGKPVLLSFIEKALGLLDHSISLNQRPDGLYHAYNLIHFCDDGYKIENLPEMLEGQVAILSSGYLDGTACLALLDALKTSRIYREDQNSYMLYPDRQPKPFLDKNTIPAQSLAANEWVHQQIASACRDFVDLDVNGDLHFNSRFRNIEELKDALRENDAITQQQENELSEVYEQVFRHRQFTGRSGSMFKYEGLGCIYWHMVSKLLLANCCWLPWNRLFLPPKVVPDRKFSQNCIHILMTSRMVWVCINPRRITGHFHSTLIRIPPGSPEYSNRA
jgi:hypothetical protein